MKTICQSKESQRLTLWMLKICMAFILLFAGIAAVKAQHKFPAPVSAALKNGKPLSPPAPPPPPAVGTWTPVATLAPNNNLGGLLLLSDGSALVKSDGGTGNGTIYNRLIPDDSGSYANGTWTSIAPMMNDRLYYSSQILRCLLPTVDPKKGIKDPKQEPWKTLKT